MTDINSIIEMIDSMRPSNESLEMQDERSGGYDSACDDIIEQLRKMSDWQDISTAPKDGTKILALFPELGWETAMYCDDKQNNPGGWSLGYDYYGDAPTHWMPLPPQPSKAL